MDNPLISVIIPVYNVEKYLRECIDSIISQTYQNLEIILINDGSPDNCPVICDNYAKSNSRVRFIHQVNQGVSIARNVGMDIAMGEWIMFCDPDDWYDLNAIEIMFNNVQKFNSDIAIFGWNVHYSHHKESYLATDKDILLTKEEKILLLKGKHQASSWGVIRRLYRKSVIDKYNIRFTPRSVISEDLMFSLKTLHYAKSISCGVECIYHYRITGNYDSCGHRYRPDVFLYYLKLIDELREFTNKEFSKDLAESIYSEQGLLLIFNAFNITFLNPVAPLSLKQRLNGIKEIILKEPWSTIINYKNNENCNKKQNISKYLLRNHQVFLYYLIKKVWGNINRFLIWYRNIKK